jgi:CBS domain-containing protein
MRVRDVLRKAPVTVPPQCAAREAAALMDLHGVGALLVVDGGELAGIVTDRDIALRCVGAGRPPTTPVSELFTPHPVTIEGSAHIVEAYRAMRDSGVRRLPVLEDGDVAGITTVDDLLVGLVLELGAVASPLVREILHPDVVLGGHRSGDGANVSPTADPPRRPQEAGR